jgi:hypothetical protein
VTSPFPSYTPHVPAKPKTLSRQNCFKANVSGAKVHVIHPTKLQFPSTKKTSFFHDTENEIMTIKILSFASYANYLYYILAL